MKHEVEVLLKSECKIDGRWNGAPPISTVRLRYWRPIHAEVMTHRKFSRNASSSRAVPVGKLAAASEDMFVPMFRKNRSGMQPGEYLSDSEQKEAERIWRNTATYCLSAALELSAENGLNIHKQWANRMLEWFGYINVIITTTDWDNFNELRLAVAEDGWPIPQDEMYELAKSIKAAVDSAPTQTLGVREWHLPYVTPEEARTFNIEDQQALSVARCASISYQTVDGKPMFTEKALALGNSLRQRQHWSPFEHQAQADEQIWGTWAMKSCHANFDGWAQLRHILQESKT
jgi:hypothetical protein